MSTSKPAPATQTFTLDFPELDREIASHDGETIFQSARRSGVRIIGACGGRGTCGTCRVLIVEGNVDGPDAEPFAEREAALGAGLPGHAEIRLHRGDCRALAGADRAGRIRHRRHH